MSEYAFNYATNNVIRGTGLINDRILLYNSLSVDTNKTVFGYYCHNIFLEKLMQFGLIPGILFCGAMIYVIIKQFIIRASDDDKGIMIILLTVGLLPLLVSYSYLSYQYYYLFIAFAVKRLTYGKKSRSSFTVSNKALTNMSGCPFFVKRQI